MLGQGRVGGASCETIAQAPPLDSGGEGTGLPDPRALTRPAVKAPLPPGAARKPAFPG